MSSTHHTYDVIPSETAESERLNSIDDLLSASRDMGSGGRPLETDDEYEYYDFVNGTNDDIRCANRVRVAFITVIVINCILLVLFVIAKTPVGQFLWEEDREVPKSDRFRQDIVSEEITDNFKLCTVCEKIKHKVRHPYNLEQIRLETHPDVCCFQKMNQLFWFFEKNVEDAIQDKKTEGTEYNADNILTTETLQKPIAHCVIFSPVIL
ncbi:uncharacterized protein LOC121375624 isoform X4 [Gigantopelta aegis]|uniref:uncharacterized protein LOC121375624 isoform X4 n=1 Tax=Gigantopelta aegis TaxID=1735272 RepID=UPI001B88CBDB|nr:uncharacterized protein LOC121375624 isoform X4 [Gigantopelta aegis]